MSSTLRAVAFDLDGTLVDSSNAVLDAVAAGVRDVTGRHGKALDVSRDVILGALGQPAGDYYRSILPAGLVHLAAEVQEAATALEVAAMQDGRDHLFPRVRETLDALRSRGFRLACISNAQLPYFRAALDHQGLAERFDHSECQEELPRGAKRPFKSTMLRRALVALEVDAADVVMVAVPMAHAEEVVALYAPLVREDALLCDINSLKADVCVALAESRGEALGTHPMFGPTVRSLRRQKVVLCDVKPGPMSAWWQAELGRMGAEVIRCSPEHHDAMMSIVQVLTHFGIIAMGRALRATGYPLASSLPYTSPIYRLELAMVGRLFSQKPELYFEIMRGNPQGEAVRATFLREAQALCDALADDDGDAFVQAFLEVRDYFADEAERSMELSDQIIETTMARP